MINIVNKLFKSLGSNSLKKYSATIEKINKFEKEISNLSDLQLKEKTPYFKEQIINGSSLEKILPEAFAVVREVAKRTVKMRHFDVQLIGGIVLHEGKITEMKTGEGKTLVATLAAYLNTLDGKCVHIVTVNDYLAKRDSEWMGEIYKALDLSVGCVNSQTAHEMRPKEYESDIVYATNNEVGFDYLRDNLKGDYQTLCFKKDIFAIVDEVDSILIDEARTPLVYSAESNSSIEIFPKINKIVKLFKDTDFEINEESKNVLLTNDGMEFAEKLLKENGLIQSGTLQDLDNMALNHNIIQGLRAHKLFIRDKDYIIKEKAIIIIDDLSGRPMEGRRYGDGLHQAIEAKEGLTIQKENQTIASITYQNFFRTYNKLSGMTGTALTEAAEFEGIYNLGVIEIPPNIVVNRIDKNDEIYMTKQEKYGAVLKLVKERHSKNQPILIGTTSVENSELISNLLNKNNIKHNVLNAKHHEREAEIILQAGIPGDVTISTNMAGRGTDIKLSKDVIDAGGLAIIGTERHDSRRVDRQLRGRSGRQGDPGSSQFYVSFEDNLMRLFGQDRVSNIMDRMGLKDGENIQHPMVTKSIERAQKKVEENNFGIRKRLLEYDDVMNSQRNIIYTLRKNALKGDRLQIDISNIMYDTIEEIVIDNKGSNNFKNFEFELITTFSMTSPINEDEFMESNEEDLINSLYEELNVFYTNKKELNRALALPVIKNVYENKANSFKRIVVPFTDGKKVINIVTDLKKSFETDGENLIEDFEKNISLAIIDEKWKNHLRKMDELKQSVQLAVHEQKDPLLIYKFEAYELFKSMIHVLNKELLSFLFKSNLPNNQGNIKDASTNSSQNNNYQTSKEESLNSDELAERARRVGASASQQSQRVETITREVPKIGRNEKVEIKNNDTGEVKTLKFKQAEKLLLSGEWSINS